ncbi:uncharacterized protein LOC128242704 isoform X2 [Mya arenaria]|uniref:uncharacterized protein LOC128242704 isoform X2 n=1 Tax=Mya arenaria TaxID=6604 RepID=UPI0022DFC2F0|nr:uncharacterized protein LOC128242704 isoform X2 [Mya arenaria]
MRGSSIFLLGFCISLCGVLRINDASSQPTDDIAHFCIQWMMPRLDEYFAHVRDFILKFIDRRPEGSRIQLNVVTDYNYNILSFTKSDSREIWTNELLEQKPGNFVYSQNGTVSSAFLNKNLKDCFDPYQDLAQISVLIGPSNTMGAQDFEKWTFKSYVIQTDESPSKYYLVSLATNHDHVLFVSEREKLERMIAEDSKRKCNTDKYWRSDFDTCESCENKCGSASLTCENHDLDVECKYHLEYLRSLQSSTPSSTTGGPRTTRPVAPEPQPTTNSDDSSTDRVYIALGLLTLGGLAGVGFLFWKFNFWQWIKKTRERREESVDVEMAQIDRRPNVARDNDNHLLPDNHPVRDTQPHDDRHSREVRPHVEVQGEEADPLMMNVCDATRADAVHDRRFEEIRPSASIQPS